MIIIVVVVVSAMRVEWRHVIITIIIIITIVINLETKFDGRWILFAKTTGSAKLKPDVSNEVSYNSQIKSFTVLSLLSASAFLTNASTIGCVGLTSIVFLELMYMELELSRNAWDFMMRSILADQPY